MSKTNFNIYLIKQDYTDHSFLKSGSQLATHNIENIGTLYTKEPHIRVSDWVGLFNPYNINLTNLYSASSSAVLITKSNERTFAITFGRGKHLLKVGSYEERFGLKVCLNTIEPEKLRTIDKKNLDGTPMNVREQSTKEGSFDQFGIDIERDLLKAVVGSPEDTSLTTRIAGADVLQVSLVSSIEEVLSKLGIYLEKFQDDKYKEHFGWIDYIKEVTDPQLKISLDIEMLTKIKSDDDEKIWMSAPDIIDWQEIEGFSYKKDIGDLLPDVDLKSFRIIPKKLQNIEVDYLKRMHVHGLNHEGFSIYEWQVYQCIYCEIERGGYLFLLCEGKWYQLEQNYVERIKQYFTSVTSQTCPITLPNAKIEEKEKDYNLRVASEKPTNIISLDTKTIQYGGSYSKIEFCDLLTINKEIIHIKKYTSSSAMSHLFMQGYVSAEAFNMAEDFRAELNKKLAGTFSIENTADKPRGYKYIFGVISRSSKELNLPFFSMVTLKQTVERLRSMGYEVYVVKILAN
jgi:uncharacterized protein (TIGR04141 family)